MPYNCCWSSSAACWSPRSRANRGRQGPLLLTLVGLAVSSLPGLARVAPSSELILAALVPPLLFSSALKFSMATLRRLRWSRHRMR